MLAGRGDDERGDVAADERHVIRDTLAGVAVEGEAEYLTFGLVRILGGSEALTITNRQEQISSVGRERDLSAFLAAFPVARQR